MSTANGVDNYPGYEDYGFEDSENYSDGETTDLGGDRIEDTYIDGRTEEAPAPTVKEYEKSLMAMVDQIRKDGSLSFEEKNLLLGRIGRLLVEFRKLRDNAAPPVELLGEFEAIQMDLMEREAAAAETAQTETGELYAELEVMKGEIEAKEGPFVYLSDEQLTEYAKKIETWLNKLDLGVEKVEKISSEVESFKKELQENQVGNPEFAGEDTAPSKIENNEAYYTEGDVFLRTWRQDKIETHRIETTGAVDIRAEAGEKVKIIKEADGNYRIEVSNSEGAVETFSVNGRAAQISLHANFEDITYQDESGVEEAYGPGVDPKIYVEGEESIEPDYRSIDFIKQLDDLIPEKNAQDILAAIQKNFGDLIPSDYKDAGGNLHLAGLKKAMKDGILPPKDPIAWGPKLLAFFYEIDLTLQNQYFTLANTKGWDAADPLTERLVSLFNAFGIQARDPGNGGNAEDNIELMVNGQWVAVDMVAGRSEGWAARFIMESGSAGGPDSMLDGAASGAAAGAVVGGIIGGLPGAAGGAIIGGAAGAIADGAEDLIDSIF